MVVSGKRRIGHHGHTHSIEFFALTTKIDKTKSFGGDLWILERIIKLRGTQYAGREKARTFPDERDELEAEVIFVLLWPRLRARREGGTLGVLLTVKGDRMFRRARWREAANSRLSRADDCWTGEVGTLFIWSGYSNLVVVIGNGVEMPAVCLEAEESDLRWRVADVRGVDICGFQTRKSSEPKKMAKEERTRESERRLCFTTHHISNSQPKGGSQNLDLHHMAGERGLACQLIQTIPFFYSSLSNLDR